MSTSTPAPGAVLVSTDSSLAVTFTQPLAASSVNAGSFLVSSADGPVAGAVTSSDATATFTPSAPLSNETEYTVRLTTAVQSAAGVALEAEHLFRFATVPVARFAYLLQAGGAVSAFALDPRSAALLRRGHFTGGLGAAQALALDRTGRFAFLPVASALLILPPPFGTVAAFAIDADSGALARVGSSSTGRSPASAAANPALDYLYVSNAYSNDVSAYAIDPSTGALAEISGSPFSLGIGSAPLRFHPAGRLAYAPVSTGSPPVPNGIGAFAVSPTTGALSPIAGSPLFAGTARASPAIAPGGKFLYAVDSSAGGIRAYAIDEGSGALTAVSGSPFPSGAAASALSFDATGRLAFGLDGTSLTAWSIDPGSGALAPLAGSPVSLPAPPVSLSVDPAGRYAALAVNGGTGVLVFSVQGGAVAAAVGSPFDVGSAVVGVDVDPSGTRLLARTATTLTLFSADAAGSLQRLFSLRTRQQGRAVAFARGKRPVTCSPSYAYVANGGSDDISIFAVDPATGALAPAAGSPFGLGAGAAPQGIALDVAGRRAFLAENGAKVVAVLAVNPASGALSSLGSAGVGTNLAPTSVAVDPSGSPVYVTRAPPASFPAGEGGLTGFGVDPGTGALTSLGTTTFLPGTSLVSVAADPTWRFVYMPIASSCTVAGGQLASTGAPGVIPGSPFSAGGCMGVSSAAVEGAGALAFASTASVLNGGLTAFTIDPATGALTSTDTRLYSGAAGSIAADPLGKYVYVSVGSGKIFAHAIDAAGKFFDLPAVGVGTGSSALALDPTGQYLFAANGSSGKVHAFGLNRATGELSPVAGSPFTAGTAPSAIAVAAACR